MKVRKIIIEACNECPYFRDRITKYEWFWMCDEMNKEITEAQSIPDWCPLEVEEE